MNILKEGEILENKILENKDIDVKRFLEEVEKRSNLVSDYIKNYQHKDRFKPSQIYDAVFMYSNYKGKALRPYIAMICTGIVGGDEDRIIPLAAAIEIYHTWTLVHDDIMDNDDKRRGGSTVHYHYGKQFEEEYIDHPIVNAKYTELAQKEDHYKKSLAKDYGRNVAILAGDLQHSWAISMIVELSIKSNFDSDIVINLIYDLEMNILPMIMEGQFLDVRFSHQSIEDLSIDEIIDMEAKKTGVLYGYCGKAGAYLGAGKETKVVKDLEQFTFNAGIAFQLQDDILGIMGDEEILGKPVGSDIREGKRTLIIYHAYKNINDDEKKVLDETLGKKDISEQEIQKIRELFIKAGSIDYVKKTAEKYIKKALPYLDDIEDSFYKDQLLSWAKFMFERVY